MSNQVLTKSASTANQYQSTFMPIFADAESRIKRLVVFAYWTGMPKTMLLAQIALIIKQVKKDIPTTLYNREQYINGLIKSSQRLVAENDRMNLFFRKINNKVVMYNERGEIIRIRTPQQFKEIQLTQTQKLWSEAKGVPYIEKYDVQLRKYINNVSDRPFVSDEKGKKPISLWQKAELDVRHNKQMEMYEDLMKANVEYAWISSHPDCSERCEMFQGELVSLTKHAKNPQKSYRKYKDIKKDRFVCEEKDGHKVYSLPDIMACTDKYGYNNMIISGFNCRHRLSPYTNGSTAPTQYSKGEVAKQRTIEQKIREKERHIRLLKMKLNDYTIIDDKKPMSILKKQIKLAENEYKHYCERNGYAWYKYRIDVNDNRIYTRSN